MSLTFKDIFSHVCLPHTPSSILAFWSSFGFEEVSKDSPAHRRYVTESFRQTTVRFIRTSLVVECVMNIVLQPLYINPCEGTMCVDKTLLYATSEFRSSGFCYLGDCDSNMKLHSNSILKNDLIYTVFEFFISGQAFSNSQFFTILTSTSAVGSLGTKKIKVCR